MIKYLHVCLLPVPSRFVKNCLLWISHHWKAPLSWTQVTLPSNIHTVPCRSMHVLMSLWICLCHSTWHLRSLQHKSVQIAPVTQILVHYISNRTKKTHHLVKISYSQHNLFEGTWFILVTSINCLHVATPQRFPRVQKPRSSPCKRKSIKGISWLVKFNKLKFQRFSSWL